MCRVVQWSRLRTNRAVTTPIWSDSKKDTVVSGHQQKKKKKKRLNIHDSTKKMRKLILQTVHFKSIRLQQMDAVGVVGASITVVEV